MRPRFLAACVATVVLVGCRSTDVVPLERPAATGPEVTERRARAPSDLIEKHEAQAVDPDGDDRLDDPITCLARAIYWEARGEEAPSMEAVASVVMNRLTHEGFPKAVCSVVMQGKEQGSCQFSWWCDGRSDQATEDESYATCKEIARRALNRQLTDRTGGALYFHHRNVTPSWSRKYTKTVEIGEFAFYKPAAGEAR